MFYVLDENNNKVDAYDAQGVLAAIEKAIADGSLANLVADAAFVTKLKCCVGGGTHHVAFVTQAKYNELKATGNLIADCLYYITDDTTADDINATLETLTEDIQGIRSNIVAISNGGITTGYAKKAVNYVTNTSTGKAESIADKFNEIDKNIAEIKDGTTPVASAEMAEDAKKVNGVKITKASGVINIDDNGLFIPVRKRLFNSSHEFTVDAYNHIANPLDLGESVENCVLELLFEDELTGNLRIETIYTDIFQTYKELACIPTYYAPVTTHANGDMTAYSQCVIIAFGNNKNQISIYSRTMANANSAKNGTTVFRVTKIYG